MKILVVGAGAVGGYFGGRLAQAGRDITFLVRPARAEQLRASGLRIISPHGDVTLSPRLVLPGKIAEPFDAVLVALKAYTLEAAMDDFAPAVGPATLVVPFLNGLRHLDQLAARFGGSDVLGGVAIISSTVRDDGTIEHLNGSHGLIYGERSGEATPRAGQLHAALSGAGFEARLSPVILQEMWEKWIFLATLGGINGLLRATVGEIEAVPGGADLTRQFYAECAAIAGAFGHPPRAKAADSAHALLLARGSKMTSSMYRDLLAGKPIEGGHIIGDLLRRAQERNVATPLLAVIDTQLRIYQERRDAAKAGNA
ncbi:MAG: ketopantoate reductase family protein [Verrucomicrobiota bacterium]